MKRLFVLLALFPVLAHAQSCLDDAIAAIQNVDSRGDFVFKRCDPGKEFTLSYETTCSAGEPDDFLVAEVVVAKVDKVLTCNVSVDGSGGDCPSVFNNEYFYETRKEFNKNRKLIRELCKDLPWTLARISISGDDSYQLYVNGEFIGGDGSWFVAETWNVYLSEGKNVIAVLGHNNANGLHPGAMIADISIGENRVVTNSSWTMSTQYVEGWEEVDGSLVDARPAIEYGSIYHPTWWYRYYGNPPIWLMDYSEFPSDSDAQWIWSEELNWDADVYFRKEIFVD